jgi:hypothetical protein
MTRKTVLIVSGAVAAVIAAGGTGAALATGGDDGEGTLSGSQAEKARAAALKIMSGGTVTAIERDNEKGATYEVEVRRADGTTVDVRLDGNYQLVAVDGDSESTSDTN